MTAQSMNTQAERDAFWFRLAGWIAGKTFVQLWRAGITLAWIAVIAVAMAEVPVVGAFAVVVAVGLIVAGHWIPLLREFAPFTGDYRRRKRRKHREKIVGDGLEFLLQTGLLSEQKIEELNPDVSLTIEDTHAVFVMNHSLPGISPNSFVEKAKQFEALLDAKRSHAEPLPRGGLEMTFYLTDPLDEAVVRHEPGELDPEKMRVECAINGFGDSRSITFGDNAGMVVGGVPGSGKTAGVSSFLLPLALSKYVELSVIDGKGGSDWSSYGGVADRYIAGADGLEQLELIEAYLKTVHDDMVNRVGGLKDALGQSNFWNSSADQRLSAGFRFKLVVIDEAHELFEQKGKSKEEKALMDTIERYITSIVKRGRSAGCFVILITQKPTADALPTSIRDNSGLKVAFRLLTSQAETAVLGASSSDGIEMPSAVEIPPERKGGAVLGNDEGLYEAVRFFYIEESEQEKLLNAAA